MCQKEKNVLAEKPWSLIWIQRNIVSFFTAAVFWFRAGNGDPLLAEEEGEEEEPSVIRQGLFFVQITS